MVQKESCKTFLLYASAAIIATLLFYVVFRYLIRWILPFLIAFAVARTSQRAMHFLQKKFRLKRGIAAFFCTLAILFLLGGVILYFSTALLSEAKRFLSSLPDLVSLSKMGNAQIEKWFSHLPENIRNWLQTQEKQSIDLLGKAAEKALSFLSSLFSSLPQIILACTTAVLALFFTLTSYDEIKEMLRQNAPPQIIKAGEIFRKSVFSSFGHWLRCESILCFITFLQLLLGFFLLHLSYPLLYAFLITIVDALPIFGTGTILIPWAILSFLFGHHMRAIILLLLFATTSLIRSCLQPHLMSEKSSLPPLASLLAMYLGFCSFGISGMVLFPVFLLLGEQIFRSVKKRERMA